ncbi:peptidoglycan editing factor PgeF [Cognaticolwellia beringensis]|uniref:peptidoglycan editing factor PgeF n=1 Tax=Cognaticolwellia beringensis TaxID=1967665 RepID=UPI0012FCB156|nr:peptidoglycan editing factor PgeF [Cognaticolwellia beringensis]
MITKLPDNLLCIKWPTTNVLAITTTRLSANIPPASSNDEYPQLNIKDTKNNPSEFHAFNLGEHVGDCATAVAQNRKSLLKYLPSKTKIQWLEQVHGNNVAIVEAHDNTPIVADAAITRSRHIALAIMTADCLPILLSNKDGSEIAAIHAGWRPLAANIVERTISTMLSPADEVFAWLGPCIGAKAFEVGEDVKQAFCKVSPKFNAAFQPISPLNDDLKPQKYLANLPLIAELQLFASGVKSVAKLAECTFEQSDKYYSYRRDGKTGRMASVICLN